MLVLLNSYILFEFGSQGSFGSIHKVYLCLPNDLQVISTFLKTTFYSKSEVAKTMEIPTR